MVEVEFCVLCAARVFFKECFLVPFHGRRYIAFCRSIKSGSLEDSVEDYDALMIDLYAIQAHLMKLHASASASRREEQVYREQQQQLRAAILKAESDIENRKRKLDVSREELQRQKEYEEVKQDIVKISARSTTSAEMAAVQNEMKDLNRRRQKLEENIAKSKMLFDTIVQTIDIVCEGIKGGDESDGTEENEDVGIVQERNDGPVPMIAD